MDLLNKKIKYCSVQYCVNIFAHFINAVDCDDEEICMSCAYYDNQHKKLTLQLQFYKAPGEEMTVVNVERCPTCRCDVRTRWMKALSKKAPFLEPNTVSSIKISRLMHTALTLSRPLIVEHRSWLNIAGESV